MSTTAATMYVMTQYNGRPWL